MISRNVAIALAVLAVLALALVAQGAIAAPVVTPGMQRAHQYAGSMFDKLGLTADQKAKLESIKADFRSQRQAVTADKSLTPDARKARLREIRSNERAQINQVLTPAQQQQLRDLMKARKAKMAEALGLTPDQQAQIKSIRQSSRADIKAVMADQTLTPVAKAAKIREIRTATKAKIDALLTPEQRAKVQAHRASKVKGSE